jgi:hypothetical protein
MCCQVSQLYFFYLKTVFVLNRTNTYSRRINLLPLDRDQVIILHQYVKYKREKKFTVLR